ncbi:MAG TPA: patatin-like phospholipase family protein [Thermoflexia bacterium]|nr:patatin-like phospholipase family protein [Thermoflexia bacterium]
MWGALWKRLRRGFRLPRVGLALSGGGVRGLAHIGVLKVLEQEGIPIHFLAGTSMGGFIAAAYAAGFSPADLEAEALQFSNPRHLIGFLERSLPRRGLVAADKIEGYLRERLGDATFDRLRLPLALVAVDLNSGEKVVLREGSVVEAVRATTALPGVFPPVERDGQLLVDGGLLDNLPADVVREMGADVVIAVDVSTDEKAVAFFAEALQRRRFVPEGLVELMEVLWRSVMVMQQEANRRSLEAANPDVLIRPPIPAGVMVLSGFGRAAEVIRAGEVAAQEALPRIRRLLD